MLLLGLMSSLPWMLAKGSNVLQPQIALHVHSVSKLYSLAFKFNFWFNLITFSILKLTHESLVKNKSQVNKIWCNYIFALNQTRSWPNSLSGSEIIYWCRPFSGVYLVVIIKLISAADCLGSGCAICISVVVLHEL